MERLIHVDLNALGTMTNAREEQEVAAVFYCPRAHRAVIGNTRWIREARSPSSRDRNLWLNELQSFYTEMVARERRNVSTVEKFMAQFYEGNNSLRQWEFIYATLWGSSVCPDAIPLHPRANGRAGDIGLALGNKSSVAKAMSSFSNTKVGINRAMCFCLVIIFINILPWTFLNNFNRTPLLWLLFQDLFIMHTLTFENLPSYDFFLVILRAQYVAVWNFKSILKKIL